MIWRDNFENGTMKLVHKQMDGLHLSEGYCLQFNGAGGVFFGGDRSDFYAFTQNVVGNHTAEAGLEPLATNDVDAESPTGARGNAGERYAIFPSYGLNWGSGNRAGSGMSVGTNRIEVVEHSANFMPVVAGVSGSFSGRLALAYTYQNGVPRIYMGDQLLRTGISTGRLVHPTIGLGLNPAINHYGNFIGKAYYLYVWDHPRTPEQLLADAYRIPKPDEQGLIFAWLLDEGEGTTVHDWSKNQFHEQIRTGPTWQPGLRRAGVRIVEIDLSPAGTVEFTQIKWSSTTPNGSGVTIETNVSLDGGATWLGWKQCTDGGAIPDLPPNTDLSNARLKIWEHIHTYDPEIDPVLHSVAIGINEEVVTNLPPIARAGEDQQAIIGNRVDLDGTGSEDPEGQDLIFIWAIVEKPEGSEAEIINPSLPTPHFFPDVAGDYLIRLVVNDGEFNSEPDFVTVKALPIENYIDILLESYLSATNYVDVVLSKPSRATNLVDILLVTWPPHHNFVETLLVKPVQSQNLVDILIEARIFKETGPPVDVIWEQIEHAKKTWERVEEGIRIWERLL